jgi:cyclic pyranopterin phosphate synthase
MVDIGKKFSTRRKASAQSVVSFNKKTFKVLQTGKSAKGSILETAKIAGINAAKNTFSLIPLCHPLILDFVNLEFKLNKKNYSLKIISTVKCEGKTGLEMEALTAAAIAGLTIYDMLKAIDKGIIISEIKLLKKSGGKSGNWNGNNFINKY